MKRLLILFVVFMSIFLLLTCSSEEPKGGEYGLSDERDWHGGAPLPPSGAFPGGETSGLGEGTDQGGNKPIPASGQLTSGEWSDIKNYDFYLSLFNIIDDSNPDIPEEQQRSGFSKYINYFGFETRFMITVNVESENMSVGDATVELYDSNQDKLFTAKTDVRGNAYLFPSYDLTGENITVIATSGSYQSTKTFVYSSTDKIVQITLDDHAPKKSVLDLMFVIDTTGSMGDELNYLKSEIDDVIGKISANNPNYTINLALLFYRDIGDEYVTKYFDFTTNITLQQQNLSKQSANGGGDFPEAVDKALEEAVAKNWSNDYATRLIFHVLDAPPHDKQENQTLFFNSIKKAAEKGIRIIPIASSGIDKNTEYLLRQEALMTGGTYIFLTDDSGIGNSHLKPTIGEYTVEYLNACMVRVVNEYLTGIETEPVSYY